MTNTTPVRRPRRKRRTPWAQYIVLLLIALWAVTVTIFIALFAVKYGVTFSAYKQLQEENEVLTRAYIDAGHQIEALQEQVAELSSYVPEHSTTDETEVSSETTTPPEEQVSDDMIIDMDYSYLFTNEKERDYVERVVMQEAGNQPFDDIVAVAQCILNTSLAKNCTAYQTVTAKDQYAPPYTKGDPTEEVLKAVSYVFDLGQTSLSEPVRYFYSTKYDYYSSWHETSPNLEYVCTIADHKFFKIKGT